MVSIENLRFNVNEEKRTVVAIGEININAELERRLDNVDRKSEPFYCGGFFGSILDDEFGKRTIAAKAVCAPEDEWNVETGIRLARARLDRLAAFKTMAAWNKLVDRLNSLCYAVEEVYAREAGKAQDIIDRSVATEFELAGEDEE